MDEQKQDEAPKPAEATADTPDAGRKDGTDWKAEARKWEARAKSNHEMVGKMKATIAADAEALDGAKAKNDEMAKQLAELGALETRRKAATEQGLPAEAADFLTATEPDQLKAQAEKLAGLLTTKPSSSRLAGIPPVDDTKHHEGVDFVNALIANARR